MGYEVKYHYYPRKEEGIGYDVDAPDAFTKQLGKMEEVPVEKLANAVMMQLARRDIMVYDVEIYEYTKRKVSFKETRGGVLIKNKRFMLDGTVETVAEEEVAMPSYIQPQAVPPQPPIVEKQPNQAIRWEVFDPDTPIIAMLTRRFKLTPKRKYPILEERTVVQRVNVPGGGMTEMPTFEYLIIDDTGQRTRVPSIHFTPEQKGLIGMEHTPMTELDYQNAPKLLHTGNYGEPDMPVLRR